MQTETCEELPDARPAAAAEKGAVRAAGSAAWTLLTCVSVLLAAVSVAGLVGRLWWMLDLSNHFRVHYGVSLMACTLLFCAGKQFRRATLPGLFAVLNLLFIVPLYAGEAVAGGRVHRALLINADFRNTSPEKVATFVGKAEADVVVIVEFTPSLLQALEPLQAAYPFAHHMPRTDGRGIALWSKLPCDAVEIRPLDESRFLAAVGRVSIAGKEVTVVGAHPTWPMGAVPSHNRNAAFAELARLAAKQSGPVMILGDFNCTSWSPHFQDLLQEGRLRDSRRGFGVQPTWPTWMPGVGIPIDHCLVSPGISIHDRWVGPDVGSDHYPVVIDFSLN
jgi:endonuclease/exonuclease/phosphatase (EEP) superfamily protein YafD